MRRRPGQWTPLFRDAPVRRARNLRDKSHPYLQQVQEVIESRVTHSYVGEDGRRRGDIWGRILGLTTPEKDDNIRVTEGEIDVG